ncbi:MAG: DUF1553 domain-containing protein, partial [Prosthecobacter sp.]
DLRAGYRPSKNDAAKPARPPLTKQQVSSMTKEQRKAFMDEYKKNMTVVKSMATRASEQQSPARPGTFLRTFGQSDRELIQNASDEASVPQALTMLNGPICESISGPSSKLAQMLEKATSPMQKLDTLYQAILSRRPTPNETAILNRVIADRGDKAVEDVTHALISGSQFLFVQ